VHTPSEEALQRRTKSEAILGGESVPLNAHLPVIESSGEVRLRSKSEIAYRTLALLTVALKGEGLEPPFLDTIVRRYQLQPHFTPKETAFLSSSTPPPQDVVSFTWRYESAWTLLWALGYVSELGKPSDICDVPMAVKTMKERTAEQFLNDANLRPLAQVLDQADLTYRYHWAVVDARINDRPCPAGLDPGIVYERHYALNWLIGYMDQEWDDVSTDT